MYRVTVRAFDGFFTETVDVTVAVNNKEEPGTVTVSSRQPQVNTPFIASLTDPDGSISNATWVWERSTDRVNWNEVSNSVLATYTPVSGDVGYYLRIVVTYVDGQGTDKRATSVSQYQVRESPVSNLPPRFPSSEDGRRLVREGNRPVMDVGDPVEAEDTDREDADSLTYSLSGPDADAFDIDDSTGQLRTKAAPDYETRTRYVLEVIATDPPTNRPPSP